MNKREALKSLIQENVYHYSEKPFRLASGKESHHYFNCKGLTFHPERLQLLCNVLREEIMAVQPAVDYFPDAIGGLTLGADPMAYGVSLSFLEAGQIVYPVVVRKESKDHGTGQKIEGDDAIQKVCVLDDVITTGGSTLQAVEALRGAGITVSYGFCIIDREEGGYEALAESGVKMYSLFKTSDF